MRFRFCLDQLKLEVVRTYHDKDVISIEALKEFLKEHEDEIICVGCGQPLSSAPWRIEQYPHDGGVRVKEFGGDKRWVYIQHEDYCNYQMALWKMENRLLHTNRELFREYVKKVYGGIDSAE